MKLIQHKLVRYLCLLPACLLSACITVVDVDTQEPAKVEDRAVVNGEVLPLPEEPSIQAEPLSSAPQMSAVAQKLLASSESQSSLGEWDSAANSLERALRLEPRNALLWSKLAGVRYQQQDWQQAVQLAAKSNTLSGQNVDLRRQNWNMMANAYDAIGDIQSAEKYRQMLSQ